MYRCIAFLGGIYTLFCGIFGGVNSAEGLKFNFSLEFSGRKADIWLPPDRGHRPGQRWGRQSQYV
jgi:hypothetical protein